MISVFLKLRMCLFCCRAQCQVNHFTCMWLTISGVKCNIAVNGSGNCSRKSEFIALWMLLKKIKIYFLSDLFLVFCLVPWRHLYKSAFLKGLIIWWIVVSCHGNQFTHRFGFVVCFWWAIAKKGHCENIWLFYSKILIWKNGNSSLF